MLCIKNPAKMRFEGLRASGFGVREINVVKRGVLTLMLQRRSYVYQYERDKELCKLGSTASTMAAANKVLSRLAFRRTAVPDPG